ncbi:MAG: hypothetical protein KA072_01995 [Thermoanaerobaculaceae bacterium]|nr:hypothetical protein [Thermoanaerobaculaceae bacterium]MDI9621601.1 hypothetical protein [Acidobacteriota bacterium]
MSRTRFGLYQPFIEDRNVRRLYQLKTRLNEAHDKKLPMTVVLNRILDSFFDTCANGDEDAPAWVVSATEPGL